LVVFSTPLFEEVEAGATAPLSALPYRLIADDSIKNHYHDVII
jgi:hypothetical protein